MYKTFGPIYPKILSDVLLIGISAIRMNITSRVNYFAIIFPFEIMQLSDII
jgi:hypothetical protein